MSVELRNGITREGSCESDTREVGLRSAEGGPLIGVRGHPHKTF